jgi:hypothetical protein
MACISAFPTRFSRAGPDLRIGTLLAPTIETVHCEKFVKANTPHGTRTRKEIAGAFDKNFS